MIPRLVIDIVCATCCRDRRPAGRYRFPGNLAQAAAYVRDYACPRCRGRRGVETGYETPPGFTVWPWMEGSMP